MSSCDCYFLVILTCILILFDKANIKLQKTTSLHSILDKSLKLLYALVYGNMAKYKTNHRHVKHKLFKKAYHLSAVNQSELKV